MYFNPSESGAEPKYIEEENEDLELVDPDYFDDQFDEEEWDDQDWDEE